jgi:hypothetical protein
VRNIVTGQDGKCGHSLFATQLQSFDNETKNGRRLIDVFHILTNGRMIRIKLSGVRIQKVATFGNRHGYDANVWIH